MAWENATFRALHCFVKYVRLTCTIDMLGISRNSRNLPTDHVRLNLCMRSFSQFSVTLSQIKGRGWFTLHSSNKSVHNSVR